MDRIGVLVGCGDGWDVEDLDSWIDANIFAISAAHQHLNPENPKILKILIRLLGRMRAMLTPLASHQHPNPENPKILKILIRRLGRMRAMLIPFASHQHPNPINPDADSYSVIP